MKFATKDTELWEVFNDGRETLRAVYKDGKFNTIK